MKRFFAMFLAFLVMGGIDSVLQHYAIQEIVLGPLFLLILFLHLKKYLKCENCGYPRLKNAKGAWVLQARKNCSNCGAELKPFGADSFTSGPREFWGLSLQLISALGTVFLVVVSGFLLVESDGVTLDGLIAFAVIVIPVSLLLVGAWVWGSRLLKPKSE